MNEVYFKCDKCKQKHTNKHLHSVKGSSWKGNLISFDFCPTCYEQEMKALIERCEQERIR